MNNVSLLSRAMRNALRGSTIKEPPERRFSRTSARAADPRTRFAFMPGDDNKTHGLPIGCDVSNWQSAEIDLRVWETARFNRDFYGARARESYSFYSTLLPVENVSL